MEIGITNLNSIYISDGKEYDCNTVFIRSKKELDEIIIKLKELENELEK